MSAKKVSFFVVIFDRSDRRLVEITTYEEETEAVKALFEAEDEYLTNKSSRYEVVLLGAESLDDLHKTHARYFAPASSHEHLIAL